MFFLSKRVNPSCIWSTPSSFLCILLQMHTRAEAINDPLCWTWVPRALGESLQSLDFIQFANRKNDFLKRKELINVFFLFFFFWLRHRAWEILVPRPRSNLLCPLQWRHAVLTTGLPRESQNRVYLSEWVLFMIFPSVGKWYLKKGGVSWIFQTKKDKTDNWVMEWIIFEWEISLPS